MGIVEELQAEVQRLRAEVQEWKDARKRSFDCALEQFQLLVQSETEVKRLRAHQGKAVAALEAYAALGAITGACARQALKEIGDE